MLTEAQVSKIASLVRAKTAEPFAFLADARVVYYSVGPRPILSLIQGVYDHHSKDARRILRSRIFSTEKMTESEYGMLKVAAKRATAPIVPGVGGLVDSELKFLKPLPTPPLISFDELSTPVRELIGRREFMDAAFQMAEEIPRNAEMYLSDRKVAAILIAEDGSFITASRNSNAKNRTRHAEMNLVQGLLPKRIPAGAALYVTLKCCKMCAAMIWENAEDQKNLRVIFGENDPGPSARNTIFARLAPGVESQAPAAWRKI